MRQSLLTTVSVAPKSLPTNVLALHPLHQRGITSWLRRSQRGDRVRARLPIPRSPLSNQKSAELILSEPAVVIARQLEMLNVLIGYEQCNMYKVMSSTGSPLGFIMEERGSTSNWLMRQLLGTRRPLRAHVLNNSGEKLFRIDRPFFLINSKIEISAIDGERDPGKLLGEVHQTWHPWRRRYNLFSGLRQFAEVDSGFLSWNFDCLNQFGQVLANIGRDFSGFAREIFTDTGHYVVRWEPQSLADLSHQRDIPLATRKLSLDERAVVLACAVSIDFDYFSRLSNNHSFFPLFAVLFAEGL